MINESEGVPTERQTRTKSTRWGGDLLGSDEKSSLWSRSSHTFSVTTSTTYILVAAATTDTSTRCMSYKHVNMHHILRLLCDTSTYIETERQSLAAAAAVSKSLSSELGKCPQCARSQYTRYKYRQCLRRTRSTIGWRGLSVRAKSIYILTLNKSQLVRIRGLLCSAER